MSPDPPDTPQVRDSDDPSSRIVTWSGSAAQMGTAPGSIVYILYMNDVPIASGTNMLSFTVTNLTPDTSYSFYVKAKDLAGNISVPSGVATAYTEKFKLRYDNPPLVSVDPPPMWSWQVGNWKIGPEVELTHVTSRSLTFSLNAPATASFTVNGFSWQSYHVHELLDDLWVWRGNEKIFRGRILGSSDSISEADHTVTFSSSDYRDLLTRRIFGLYPGDSNWSVGYTQKSPEFIFWDIITTMQNVLGGSLGVTKGVIPSTGVVIPNDKENAPGFVVKMGDTVKAALDKLSKTAGNKAGKLEDPGGFDWDIDSELRANLYYPKQGKNNNVVLDYGGTVSNLSRSVKSDDYANMIRQSGNDGLEPVVLPGGPYGRATAATATTLSTDLVLGNMADKQIVITYGPGVGQSRIIKSVQSNAASPRSVITVKTNWNTLPTNKSDFVIYTDMEALKTAPEGRWERFFGDTSIQAQPMVRSTAQANYARVSQINTDYGNFTLSQGSWGGPNHIWLGDTVIFVIKRGRLDIAKEGRVQSISISIDQNDVETVSITVGASTSDVRSFWRALSRRVQYVSMS